MRWPRAASFCHKTSPQCLFRITSAACGVTNALIQGCMNLRYAVRLASETRAAVAKRRSSSAVFPPNALMSSSVRCSQRMIQRPETRSPPALSSDFASNVAS